ncbi:MAG: sodium:proton antiporter [Bacteroides sp.]|nr:sodium:proton antiporter [Bacteroides sp.]MBD5363366.1 sodium:proton antiporter [Bacteroides sp.]
MIESLIMDLAYILVLGAIVSLLFKWIKQPVVLGYIVAGFLASPNFEPLPSLAHADNIDFWAEIGIVVLLFSLGLEFSFKKLLSCGSSAIVTCLVCIIGMMITGFSIGHLLGFSNINSIFLGGMISMSSTTIILKALTDLGLRHKRFAAQVFGVLIVEDLFAVLMMVILSSVAVGNVEGGEMIYSVAKLCFFLIIWFLVGTYLLPSFLNGVRRFLNEETLLVLSMALCLGMAVCAVECGFSLALGAFVMGSILAGTSYAERIEHVVAPVKNLFGAVFFISVGMMVNPQVIMEYWQPILVLSAAVVIGMILFGTTGMLLSGQTLKVAIQSGFTLTQIGEFSFIIASLGMSLGVLDPTIYPIVVAVSVITTFTTPIFIKCADPVYNIVERHLPKRLQWLVDRYSESTANTSEVRALWTSVLKRYAWRVVLYSVVLVAIALVFRLYVHPLVSNFLPGFWGRLLCCVLTLVAMAPFLLGLTFPSSKRWERERLVKANAHFDAPLVCMTVFRLLICMGFVVYVISAHFGLGLGMLFGITGVVLWIIFASRNLRHRLSRIENKFLNNLNERELRRTGANNNLVSNMHMAFGTVGYDSPFIGDRLCISNVGSNYGINVASIMRGGRLIPVPGPDERLFPGDLVGIIGTEENITKVMPLIEAGAEESTDTGSGEDVGFKSIELTESSPLLGKTLSSANLRGKHHLLVVAIQRGSEFVELTPTQRFNLGDIVWFVGQPSVARTLS